MEINHIVLFTHALRKAANIHGKIYVACHVRSIDLVSEDINSFHEWLHQYETMLRNSVTFLFADGTTQCFLDGKMSSEPEDPNMAMGDLSRPIPLTEEMREIIRREEILSAKRHIAKLALAKQVFQETGKPPHIPIGNPSASKLPIPVRKLMKVDHIILRTYALQHKASTHSKPYATCHAKALDLFHEDANLLKEWLSQYDSLLMASVTFLFEDGTAQCFLDGKIDPETADPLRASVDFRRLVPMTEEHREAFRPEQIHFARRQVAKAAIAS